jgi:ankyrin repeat protein
MDDYDYPENLPEIIKRISDGEMDPNSIDKYGHNALHIATMNGWSGAIRHYVEKLKMDPNKKNNKGSNALHIATESGEKAMDIIKYYIEDCNMDINVKDGRGCNILNIAAKHYIIKLMNIFIEKYKMDPNDPDCKDHNGNNALHHLIKHNDDYGFYHKDRVINEIKYLIHKLKMDPNVKNNDGNNALHIAMYHDKGSLEQYFIRECKMDPCVKNNKGQTICSYRYGCSCGTR